MDKLSQNPFVLPAELETFRPGTLGASAPAAANKLFAVPRDMSYFQATQTPAIRVPQGNIDRAIFGEFNGLALPLFNQVVSFHMKTIFGKGSALVEGSDAAEASPANGESSTEGSDLPGRLFTPRRVVPKSNSDSGLVL